MKLSYFEPSGYFHDFARWPTSVGHWLAGTLGWRDCTFSSARVER